MKVDNVKAMEQQASEVCREFQIFCDYVLRDTVKLAKKSGYISKKDCFELDSRLRARENFERPARFQIKYPVINYFYFAALKYRILEKNDRETGLIKGENYEIFHAASSIEKYIFFVTVLLTENKFLEYEMELKTQMWQLMSWVERTRPAVGEIYQLPARTVPGYEGSRPVLISYLEELGIINIIQAAAYKKWEEVLHWKIEIQPLYELFYDMYNQIHNKYEQIYDEGVLNFFFEAYLEEKFPGNRTGNIEKMFEEHKADYSELKVELEIRVRYGDCIRIVCMNLSDTLYDLHRTIQSVFEFDDDHLYEFYVGQGMLKETYAPEVAANSGEEIPVEETALGDLGMKKGMKFSYLFDFGDMWWFDIKVLGIGGGSVDSPQLVKAVNPAPQQYPDWE